MSDESNSGDRRVQRTRRTLHKALISLILRKSYDRITVQNIIDEADVGRATFYAHYKSKDDLLLSGFSHLRSELQHHQEIVKGNKGEPPSLEFALILFEHVKNHVTIYQALVGKHGGMIAQKQLEKIVSEMVREEICSVPNGYEAQELIIQHITGAFIFTLVFWLSKGAKQPVEEINTVFTELVLNGIRGQSADN